MPATAVQIDPEPALEDRVAAAIDTCDGDPVAAVRALLVAIDELEADVSRGYVRGRRLRLVPPGPDAA